MSDNAEAAGTITIDASTASAAIDFDAFITGGFLAGTSGGGMPVFDNSGAFSGEEMVVGFGASSSSKYVLAHGQLTYFFDTHTVWGEIGTIEYGTRGAGGYDANGYFSGGNVELRITGLADFANAVSPEVDVEATGEVHNFAVAHMYGATASPTRLALFAEQLDAYAQHFVGSAHGDSYVGTRFDDEIEGGGGADVLAGGGGDDEIAGGGGSDKAVYTGNRADYAITDNGDGTWTIRDNRAGPVNDGEDTLTGVELAEFADGTLDIDSGGTDLPPTGLALSAATVAEDAPVGTVVGTLSATDPEGQPLTYTLTGNAGGRFEIVGNELRVKVGLDYETATSHGITVTVSDGVNGVSKAFAIAVTDVAEAANQAPTGLALSAATVAENAPVGAVVGILSATDPEGQPLTYTLTGDAGGRFEIVGSELRVKAGLDYETATSHGITVEVSDGVNEVSKDFTVTVTDVVESGPAGAITIDARGASGMDFEAFIGGGFLADTTGGGMPVFDNGTAFSGEEMMIAFGTASSSKYVLAHGGLEYFFGSHTVHGTIDTIEYGTRGSGSYDANGYFTGGNVALKITGLDFFNGLAPEAEVEATGAVHNFAVGHMYGSAADPARLDRFADQLDEYAQTFLGSEGNDVYAGTRFDDTIAGGGGEDLLRGNGGSDTVDGGEGVDTFVFAGNRADYEVKTAAGVTTVTDRRSSPVDGVATLRNIEFLRFADQQVSLVADLPPVDLALSATSLAENAAVGSVVGVLSAADPEGSAVTFSLAGDADGRFEVVGNQLRLKAGLDYETRASHEVAILATDAAGNGSTRTFTIAVTDVLESTVKGGKGTKGADIIVGGGGKNRIDGGKGDDIIVGGEGRDVLKGGKGADTFVFQFASDSTAKARGRDLIKDFSRKQGDKIDVSAIDPLNDGGVFDFIGKKKFGKEAGALRSVKQGGQTVIYGDLDGDGKADFSIGLAKAMTLKEADFIL
jgi:Ca2+-binding RTX toxin-like protein